MSTRKPTIEELHLRNERDCMARLLHLQANGRKADAAETYREKDGTTYRLELWNATGGEGGLLVTILSIPGQSRWLNVYWFDDARPMSADHVHYATAYERLRLARMRAYQTA